MKTVCLSLLLLILVSCGPSFHRQKYTDFGHVKGMRFRETVSRTDRVSEQVTEKFIRERTTDRSRPESDTVTTVETEVRQVSSPESVPHASAARTIAPKAQQTENETVSSEAGQEEEPLDPEVSKRHVRKLSATGYLLFLLDIVLYLLLADLGIFVALILLGLLFLSTCFLFSAHAEGKRYIRAAGRGEFTEDPRVRKMSNRAAVWGTVFLIFLIAGTLGLVLAAGA